MKLIKRKAFENLGSQYSACKCCKTKCCENSLTVAYTAMIPFSLLFYICIYFLFQQAKIFFLHSLVLLAVVFVDELVSYLCFCSCNGCHSLLIKSIDEKLLKTKKASTKIIQKSEEGVNVTYSETHMQF